MADEQVRVNNGGGCSDCAGQGRDADETASRGTGTGAGAGAGGATSAHSIAPGPGDMQILMSARHAHMVLSLRSALAEAINTSLVDPRQCQDGHQATRLLARILQGCW